MAAAVRLPLVVEGTLDPAGELVAYVVRGTTPDGARFSAHLRLGRAEGPHDVIETACASPAQPCFSRSGALLAYRADEGIRVVRVAQDGAVLVARLNRATAFAWCGADEALWIAEDEPPPVSARRQAERAERDGNLVRPHRAAPPRQRIVRVDVDSGACLEPLVPQGPGVLAISPSPDGRSLALLRSDSGLPDARRFELLVLDVASTEVQLRVDGVRSWSPLAWSHDGAQLAYVAPRDPATPSSQSDLHVVRPADGGPPQNCSAALVGETTWVRWLPDETLLLGLAAGVESRIVRLADDGGEAELLARGEPWEVSADGTRLAYRSEEAGALPEVELLTFATRAPRRLTDHSAALRERAVAPVETVAWRGWRGEHVEGVLTLPPAGAAPHPLVVVPHGGPLARAEIGFHALANLRAQALAADGFAVLQPNCHGSTGYGSAFSTSLVGHIGEADFADLTAGVHHLVAERVADPERLAIYGGSYGGYLASWAIGHTDEFKAASVNAGVWDLVTDFGDTAEDLWAPEYLGSRWWEDPPAHRERSPSTYVERIATPVLITHGLADRNVFVSNSQQMWRALTELGREAELLLYPDEAHSGWRPVHLVDQCERVAEWFHAHLPDSNPRRPRRWRGHGLVVDGWGPAAGGAATRVDVTLVPEGPLALDVGGPRSEVWLRVGERACAPVETRLSEAQASEPATRVALAREQRLSFVFALPPAAGMELLLLSFPPVALAPPR
jgi:dipeptidyl aminopeptidase/acylaminoacyl peptidase